MLSKINIGNLFSLPLSILACIILLFFWHYESALNDAALFYFSSFMLLLLFIRAEFKYANLYSAETFFFLFVFLHHLFYPIGIQLGFVSDTTADKTSINTIFIIMLGLSALFVGCSFRVIRAESKQPKFNPETLETFIKLGLYVWMATIGLEIFLHVLSGGQAFVVRSLTKLRGEVNWIERILSLNHVIGHVGLFLLVISSLHRYGRIFHKPLLWGILLVNLALYSFTGDRQEAFIIAIVLLYLKSRITKPINIALASSVCLILVLFIVVIGEGRAKQEKGVPVYRGILEEMHLIEPSQKNNIKIIHRHKREETLIEKFWRKTGAGYYNTKRTYLNLNKKEFAYENGQSYLYALISWLPFKSQLIDYMGYSEWCAMVGDPYAWKLRGHGTGGSMIGETFWNFGIYGVMIICLLFGFLTTAIESSHRYGKSIIVKTWMASVFYSLIYMIRNDFNVFMKLICWHGFVLFIMYLIWKIVLHPGQLGSAASSLIYNSTNAHPSRY